MPPMGTPTSVVCIFRSTRTDQADDEYRAWSARMAALVIETPGYQSHHSWRTPRRVKE